MSQSEGRKEELSVDAWASWNYKEGQTVRVVCYTNTAKARLLLDNQPIGDVKNYDTKTGITYWDVPFKQGTLKVEGLNEAGNVVVTYAVTTAGEATALQVINDGKKDAEVKQVAVQLVDAKGNPVYNINAELTCTVTGGTLLGLEAGDNSDMGDYTDNVQKTFRGRLLAYVKKIKNRVRLK
ncbi:DUF4982 domain-containing protein [Niabella sp. W65]|nr:DUF4982 domain-containing protein [Niabella sp. W65]MCH7369371.1 DUF4982 domain-containing protein [Niabella sp. W65]